MAAELNSQISALSNITKNTVAVHAGNTNIEHEYYKVIFWIFWSHIQVVVAKAVWHIQLYHRIKKDFTEIQMTKIPGAIWPFVKLQLPKRKTSYTHFLPSMLLCLYCHATSSIPATLTMVVCGASNFLFWEIYTYIKIMELLLFSLPWAQREEGKGRKKVYE